METVLRIGEIHSNFMFESPMPASVNEAVYFATATQNDVLWSGSTGDWFNAELCCSVSMVCVYSQDGTLPEPCL